MLDSLHIKNFRCFEDLTIPSLGRVNLIVGKNNSGKSTLLDAIYLYANGGNAWAIKKILTDRNEFPQFDPTPPNGFTIQQPENKEKITFDALSNIFSYNKKLDTCSIAAKEKKCYSFDMMSGNKCTIAFKKITNMEEIKNDLPAERQNHYVPNEVFLIKAEIPNRSPDKVDNKPPFPLPPLREVHKTLITPQTIINDLSLVEYIPRINNNIIAAFTYQESSLANIWGHLQDEGRDTQINEALKLIEPRISRAYYSVNERLAKVQIEGMGTKPIKSMGDGVSRMFQIFILTYATQKGILLIDEIENGLHYSIQEEVWEKLFRLAKELDIQVFATTHSEDAVKAFCKVAVADEEVDGKLIALARSAKTSNEGQIFPIIYEEDKLQTFIEMGMEVR
jgi:AAA15 family ATPase/GTPase